MTRGEKGVITSGDLHCCMVAGFVGEKGSYQKW
jgi:hypothetical protein